MHVHDTLKVFQIDEGQYYVESSEGKVCYRVSLNALCANISETLPTQ